MDIKKFQSFMILLEGLSGNFLCIYSVAKEPNLEEWTCRAESSDLLYEPVGSNPKLIYILSMIVGNGYNFVSFKWQVRIALVGKFT